MVIRKKLRPESWVKGFQGGKTNWRSRSVLRLLVLHMQSQARSTYLLHCLEISWLYVKNCNQNRGSKIFREEKKIGAREALFDCQYSIYNHKRGLPTLYLVWKFHGYTWKTATRIVGQRFLGKKKIGAREALFDCQYSICNPKRGLPTLYIVCKFHGYT